MNIEAIEEAFLLADWRTAMVHAREGLQREWTLETAVDAHTTSALFFRERLLSVYLQCIFELAEEAEVSRATDVIATLHPLPFKMEMQWIKFLAAMGQNQRARVLLEELKERITLTIDLGNREDCDRYYELWKAYVQIVLAPHDDYAATELAILDDGMLTADAKQRLCQLADSMTSTANNTPPSNAQASTPTTTTAQELINQVSSEPACGASTATAPSESFDATNSLLVVGGVVAAAAVAISTWRLKDKLPGIATTITKSLADAKTMERDPCPFRIVEDAGGGFVLGAVFGSGWHAFKGARNSPTGHRFHGALYNVKTRTPTIAGGFAMWGLLFSSFDCTLEALRRKEDPWNSIIAGAATGGLLAARAGPRAAASSALVGGLILASIEGVSIMVQEYFATQQPLPYEDGPGGENDEQKLAPPPGF
ncbi:TPA: hypothetical protein N0F65_010649 [Lagenidium giganteum]|uniref:Uncharacterized protein n=1 Tax=Lagenidium giganteum TaxID=4803 RepID=A0AAV2ZCH7_9STRA|nr:TPA: hypothetical protein N0F65_010649 [Lagenidium giganteum]